MTTQPAGHTKGPLHIKNLFPTVQTGWDICDDAGRWIGIAHTSHDNSRGFPSDSEGEANAQLWAAAPELLEDLKSLHAFTNDDCRGKCPTAKLIAKAEGLHE